VRDAKVTVVHNQLRDLVFPLARGKLLYPKGNSIVEHSWTPPDEEDEDEDGVVRGSSKSIVSSCDPSSSACISLLW
jgi:hypothetical protein